MPLKTSNSATAGQLAERLAGLLPSVRWLPRYRRTWLRADVLAGIALAGLLIPESMGYATMAGAPPQAGLYASMMGLFIYALLGTSRHLAVTPTSALAIMVAAVVGPMAAADPDKYLAFTGALVLMVGAVFLAARVASLGFISDFLARPVITGFVFGLALIIIVRQTPKLLGIPKGEGDFFQMVRDILLSLGQAHSTTLAVSISALAALIIINLLVPRLPAALLVMIAGIAAGSIFDLQEHGVAVVGAVPSGLPGFSWPDLSWQEWTTMLPDAAGLALVAFAEGLGAARTFALRHRYDIDPNQELMATGLANVGSGLVGGIAVGGGLSGSSVNEGAGAKSEVSALAASAFMLLTLLLLTPLFHNLPEAVLGAVVVYAVRHMLNLGEIRRFARIRRDSLGMSLSALFGVLVFRILPGLIIAVVMSLVVLARELSRPRVALLGRMKDTGHWVDAGRHPEAARIPGVAIYRIQGVLFFASADVVRKAVRKGVLESDPVPASVILDLEALVDIDVTSVIMLDDLSSDLERHGVDVILTNVHTNVKEVLAREGLIERLGPEKVLGTVDEAVARYS